MRDTEQRLRWTGWIILAVGGTAALLIRLLTPQTQLSFAFLADPAITVFVVTMTVALLLLAAGGFIGWQNQRIEQALTAQATAQETERRRFIQRLDHELKNPLTAIQIQLDNLQNASANAEVIGAVRAQADRLTQLTRSLRRLADLETRPLEIESIEIPELLAEVIDLLQAPERIALEIQRLPWPIPPIEGDRELLLVAFRNLTDNALKYSPPDTTVHIRARHTAGHLVVEIIDTGRGIPPEEVPLATEELYRGTNAKDVAGSGLGLAIVRRIIERHGGRLEIRSRLGQGTIVTVQLPYEQKTLH